jgi:hypothetical protein
MGRVLETIASVVRAAFAVIAALILVHAVFVLFEANRANALVELTEGVRDTFGWFTRDLFTKPDATTAEVINDALAAVIWVVVGSFVSKLILRLAPRSRAKA